jgi:hypothetical protein
VTRGPCSRRAVLVADQDHGIALEVVDDRGVDPAAGRPGAQAQRVVEDAAAAVQGLALEHEKSVVPDDVLAAQGPARRSALVVPVELVDDHLVPVEFHVLGMEVTAVLVGQQQLEGVQAVLEGKADPGPETHLVAVRVRGEVEHPVEDLLAHAKVGFRRDGGLGPGPDGGRQAGQQQQ